MTSTIVKLDTRRIHDWDSFHDVFADVFSFPDFYGRNMNAWIDCFTSLDEPEDGMTAIHAPKGGVLTIHLEHCHEFAVRCPDLYEAIIECAAFVNWRRIETDQPAVLALSFWKDEPMAAS